MPGAPLKPVFLTIPDVYYNNYDLCIQKDLCVTCRASKGYMTSESMTIYSDQIMQRYCERLRREHDDDRLPVYFVMDNYAAHNRLEHLQLMASLLMHSVQLPPHFTHCLPPLDLTLFGVYKIMYRGARTPATKPKLGMLEQEFHSVLISPTWDPTCKIKNYRQTRWLVSFCIQVIFA
jgi:hypothetical protein